MMSAEHKDHEHHWREYLWYQKYEQYEEFDYVKDWEEDTISEYDTVDHDGYSLTVITITDVSKGDEAWVKSDKHYDLVSHR